MNDRQFKSVLSELTKMRKAEQEKAVYLHCILNELEKMDGGTNDHKGEGEKAVQEGQIPAEK